MHQHYPVLRVLKNYLVVFISTIILSTISLTTSLHAQISFGVSTLSGVVIDAPTSLQFGPDDRLYISDQKGKIYVHDVQRNDANDYVVTSTEVIYEIANMQNRNDDGSISTTYGRQVTGILVVGTAANPILYVSSSDPRHGAGGSGTDSNLDTNSGIVSRLDWDGTAWVKTDLVRGLPRSEENHSSNGMQIDEANGILYLAQGGHTNMGAQSNNFALHKEYAYSSAILTIDLNAIGNTTYDLPTLDDEDQTNSGTTPGFEDPSDPFGGNNGKNQAMLEVGGPVQVYSGGWRNPYDVLITENGKLYTFDNGPNAGWGAAPTSCTYTVEEPGDVYPDNLHLITGPGYYGGHPNLTRGNIANTFNPTNPQSPVPASLENPVECDYKIPLVEDGAITTINYSSNGLAEYTASNFSGAMQGDLVVAALSSNGQINRIELNTTGNALAGSGNTILLSGFAGGGYSLDVIAQGDFDFYPGTIWSANIYGANKITVFEPADYDGGVINCDPSDPLGDEDLDGYSNGDEADNNTNPCSAGSIPPDWDGDLVSDLNDNDDDDDGILDFNDELALDPDNGTTTNLPIYYTWDNGAAAAGGLLNLGFYGFMSNGTDDYLDLYDTGNMTVGGAAGILSIDAITDGDATGTINTQEYGFQLGVNVAAETEPFFARTSVLAPFAGITPQDDQAIGIYVGDGTQSNYVKMVVSANGGAGGIEVVNEINDVPTSTMYAAPVLGSGVVNLFLVVDPVAATVQPAYTIDGSLRADLGSPIAIPASWLNTIIVGLIATANGSGSSFPVTWGELQVSPDATGTGTNTEVRINCGGPDYTDTQGYLFIADTYYDTSVYMGTFSTTNNITNTSNPTLYQTERFAYNDNFHYEIPLPNDVYTVRLHFAELYYDVANGRLFDITLEGSSVLSNYDIWTESGGKYVAIIENFSLPVTDGFLNIDGNSILNGTKLSAIEVLGSGVVTTNNTPPTFAISGDVTVDQDFTTTETVTVTPDPVPAGETGQIVTYSLSPVSIPFANVSIDSNTGEVSITSIPGASGTQMFTIIAYDGEPFNNTATQSFQLTVTPTGGGNAVAIRINCAGPDYTDGAGNLFIADTYYNTIATTYTYSSTNPIANTVDDVLYQTERFAYVNNLHYEIPVPNDTYTVNLHFSELYFDAANSRVFDMSIEGTMVLDDYDIWVAAGGKDMAHIEQFTTTVSDGILNIDGMGIINAAKLSAIEVIGSNNTPTNTPPTFVLSGNINVNQGFNTTEIVTLTPDPVPPSEAGQVVTYSLNPASVSFANVSIDSTTGEVTISSVSCQSGSQIFTVTADDGQTSNNIATETFTLTVNTTGNNTPPTFTTSGDVTINQDFSNVQTVTVTPDAVPPCETGQTVTYSISPPISNLANISIDAATGEVSVSAIPCQNGTQTFTITADDGQGNDNTASESFMLEIIPAANTPPTFTTSGDVTVVQSFTTTEIVTVTPDPVPSCELAQVVSYSLSPASVAFANVNINTSTGEVSITSIACESGAQTFTITADDGAAINNTVTQTFVLTVTGGNAAPTFTTSGDVTVDQDFTTTETVTVTPDPVPSCESGQIATYSLSPASASFANVSIDSATGEVTITAVAGGAGTQLFNIIADDGQAGNNIATSSFMLTVNSSGGGTDTEIRINCGGPDYTDSNSNLFIADTYYDTSVWTSTYSTPNAISNTVEEELYQTERVGYNLNLGYEIPVPDDTYTVILHFAELYFDAANSRVFDILIEGTVVLDDYDIWTEAGGKYVAIVETFTVLVTDGFLNIDGSAIVNGAKLSAIEIIGSGSGGGTSSNTAPSFTTSGDVTVDQDFTGTEIVTVTPSPVPPSEAGQTVTYSINPASVGFANVSIDSTTGEVSITAIACQSGTQVFTITADDGQATDNTATSDFTLTVNGTSANTSPNFTATGNITVFQDFTTTETVTVTPDPVPTCESGQVVTYSLIPPAVSFADVSIDSTTGEVTINSVPCATGVQLFGIKADDGQATNFFDIETFTLTVTPLPNTPPNFTTTGDVTVNQDFTTTEIVSVTPDPVPPCESGQTVTYSLIPATVSFANVSIDSTTGEVTINSVPCANGSQVFGIKADDGQSSDYFDISSFTLTVMPVINTPPAFTISGDVTVDQDFIGTETVTVTPNPVPPCESGQVVSYSLSPASVSFANVSIDSTTGEVSITSVAGETGTQSFLILANDGQPTDYVSAENFTLTVNAGGSHGGGGTTNIRINCGGADYTDTNGNLFVADTYYDTSTTTYTYYSSHAIYTTLDDELYQTERNGYSNNLRYAIPVDNGTYMVRLHFAELYWNSIGQRIFDVELEGNLALDDLDIYEGVAKYRPMLQEFTVNVTDGELNIQIYSIINAAKISAIEVLGDGATSAINNPPSFTTTGDVTVDQDFTTTETVTVTQIDDDESWQTITYSISPASVPFANVSIDSTTGEVTITAVPGAAGSQEFTITADDGQATYNIATGTFTLTVNAVSNLTEVRINCGGPSYVSTAGATFMADDYYDTDITTNVYNTTHAIYSTSDDALYQKGRTGTAVNYAIPLSMAGTYTVRLHFAEIKWNSLGKRVFDVKLEGNTVIADYDIYGQTAKYRADVYEFTQVVTDGYLNIELAASERKAAIAAIEVLGDSVSKLIGDDAISNASDSEILLLLYPNPAQDIAKVTYLSNNATSETGAEPKEVKLGVYDILGRELLQLHQTPVAGMENTFTIDVSNFERGYYIVRLDNGEESISKKLLVH